MLVSEIEKKDILKPGFCCFGIVDSCMLRCKMCHKWKDDILIQDPKAVPNMAEWKRSVDYLKEITEPGFLINFGGGEALLDGVEKGDFLLA